MKRTITFFTTAMWMLMGYSYPFGTHWIAAQQVDSTAQIWFRQQLYLHDLPVHASVTVATTGKIDLYINERNVSTAICIPSRTANDNQPVSINMEVTRFLQPGNNIIAIWYSPTFAHINEHQIAFSLSGRMNNGNHIALQSDKTWLTRRANVSLAGNDGEQYDANQYRLKWNSDDIDWATWQPAQEINTQPTGMKYHSAGYPAEKRNKTYTPRYFDLSDRVVYYQFDNGFNGQLRVTLRNAKQGQKIYIDGLEYTCSGEMDEQACRKFTATNHRRVQIWGDKNFKNEQIQTVEGIEIVRYFHDSLQY